MSGTTTLTELIGKAAELRAVRDRAWVLEQELTEIGYELARHDLGDEAVAYLRDRGGKLLLGQSRGEVSERLLFSALEDAYRAGRFKAQGGRPGPAPVTPEETRKADGHGAG
jgi:hypothetical protein